MVRQINTMRANELLDKKPLLFKGPLDE